MQNLFNIKENKYFSLDLDEEDNYSSLELNVIWHNQILEGKYNFPDFDLRETFSDRYSYPLAFLKTKNLSCGLHPTSP